MLKEFKEFISHGNVLDMAVGVVMGAAFKAIVDSFVADIIMPIIGLLVGDISLSDMKYVINPAVIEAGEEVKPELAIAYGNLIQTVINFLIIAVFVFLMVKAFNKARSALAPKEEAAEEAPAAKADDIVLLEEIRDLLKNK